MLNELSTLKLFLYFSFLIAPLATGNFFLKKYKKLYIQTHVVSLFCLLLFEVFMINVFIFAWPLFCVFSCFLLFVESDLKVSVLFLSRIVPLVFSVVSSVWFVSASLNLELLGYDIVWSMLAAIHGAYIGWLLLAGFSQLQTIFPKRKAIYQVGVFLCFFSFMAIALGIDGIPYLKRWGLWSFVSVILTLLSLLYLDMSKKNFMANFFFFISVCGLALTIVMAVFHEYTLDVFGEFTNLSSMIYIHGGINSFVVIPAFLCSVFFLGRDNAV